MTMLTPRRTIAALGAATLLAAPMTVLTAAPASAADREFRYAGAEVEFDVEKDDGRFEIEVDIDDAKPGSRWRVVLRHNGNVYHKRVHRADSDGEVEIDKERRDTPGRDVFKLRVKRIGADKAAASVIRRR
jgi:hypothetical protein